MKPIRIGVYAVIASILFGALAAPAGEGPITVKVGEEFEVTLDSNPTTGYGWRIAAPPDKVILVLVGAEYRPDGKGMAGSGGKEIYTFKALAPGETTITFTYVRPWEEGQPPAAQKQYAVIVKEAGEDRQLQEMQAELDRLHSETWDERSRY